MTIRDFPRIIPPLWSKEKYNNMNMNGHQTKVPRVKVTYSRKKLYLAALAGNLLYLSTGCVISWPSPTIPKLQASANLSDSDASWIGSIYALGAALGPVITAICIDTIGRKGSLIATALVFLVSWIIIGVSQSLPLILIGRIVGGVGVGASFACVSCYLAEIADNEVRGAIGSVNQMFVSFGLLIEYCVGPYVSYSALVGTSASVAVMFILVILLVPESPYYLMSKGRRDKAVQALCWLRGNLKPPLVQRELTDIEETLAESRNATGSKSDLFFKKGPRRALLISLWSMLCQQISGVNVVFAFTQPIFQMASQNFPPQFSPMLIGGVNIISSAFAPPLVRTLGLKPVLIGSSFGMALCQMVLSLYFYLRSNGTDVSNLDWLPISSLVIFSICFSLGAGSLPWTSVAELFSSELKGFASCVIGAYVWIIAFIVMKLYQNVLDTFGQMSTFLFFGVAELIGVIVLCFVQPSTKNLSFQEIQDLLNGTPPHSSDDFDKDSLG